MPGMSGRELAERLREQRPDIAIIFMSGYSDQTLLNRQELDGAYLAKPFSPAVLARKVREILGEAPRATGNDPDRATTSRPSADCFARSWQAPDTACWRRENGREAMQQIETSGVDLLITDLAMPEQEGIETIMMLHRTRPHLKIIAISGQFSGILDASRQFGAWGSIAKPIQPQVLLDTVARALAG